MRRSGLMLAAVLTVSLLLGPASSSPDIALASIDGGLRDAAYQYGGAGFGFPPTTGPYWPDPGAAVGYSPFGATSPFGFGGLGFNFPGGAGGPYWPDPGAAFGYSPFGTTGPYGFGGLGFNFPSRASRSGATTAPTQRVRLTIGDDVFYPAELTVPARTRVAWVNTGSNVHRIVGSSGWDSGPINPGDRWAADFEEPGTYEYSDPAYPEMRGRLVVTAR